MSRIEWQLSAERSKRWMYDLLACPTCKGELAPFVAGEEPIRCRACGESYPWLEHIPILIEQKSADQALLKLANAWNHAAPVWSSTLGKRGRVLDATERPLLDAVRGTVLEVGCGDGRLFPRYEERGLRAIGIDFSVEMLKRAASQGFPLALADAHHMPFKEGSMDAVIVPFATIRFLEYETFFQESYRILRTDGVLGFVAWNDRYNFRYRGTFADWRTGRDVRDLHAVIDPLASAGFTVRTISGVFSFPRWIPVLSRIVIPIPGTTGAALSRDMIVVAKKRP